MEYEYDGILKQNEQHTQECSRQHEDGEPMTMARPQWARQRSALIVILMCKTT